MNKAKLLRILWIFGLMITISLSMKLSYDVSASEIIMPDEYFFVFNGQRRKAGVEYEMKSSEVLLNITAEGWSSQSTVTWISSEPGVVTLERYDAESGFVKMIRKGPGYSTITAVVKQGNNTYSLSCLVKVSLEFNVQKTGLQMATTTKERILIIDSITDANLKTKQIYLKYVDYTEGENGDPIEGDEIIDTDIEWESDNENVAVVDERGRVTGVGSGSALITATSKTMSSQDKPMSISLRVVVAPNFTLTYDDAKGVNHVVQSSKKAGVGQPALGVPSNFVIESEATIAEDLTWVVYDTSTGKKLPVDGPKLKYSVSKLSGNVSFSSVKAGTYEIYAFANDKYNADTNAPYAYMKIIVPIELKDLSLVMSVGDTYDLVKNSNIPGIEIFNFVYVTGNANTAQITPKGIVNARRKGHVKVRLVYRTEHDLFDDQLIIDGVVQVDIELDITIIDGIALNMTNAIMYSPGTLLLQATVTDPTEAVVWSTSDASIATVEDGLVTSKKPGIVKITATQVIDGVSKSASCDITVQKSVSKITVSPDKAVLNIGDYQALLAEITPKDLTNVTLQWKSSDDKVVKIVDQTGLTATVQGVSGGNAVISAINQDNVVVGFAHITVKKAVTSVVLSETDVTVDSSVKRLQLRATVYPEDAANKNVNWTTTDAKIAKVDNNGLVTILKPGKVSVIATSQDNANARAICNITILVPVTEVSLDTKDLTMYVGQTHRLTYLIQPADSSSNAVTWMSTNNKVVAVDSTGRLTAKGVGTAVIVLKTLDGGYDAYCTVNVKRVATGIKFDISNLTLKTGEYYFINPQLTPKDSTETDLIWESSDTRVATVERSGKVTARSAGTTIIMAKTESGAMAYTRITVVQGVESLLLNLSETTIHMGDHVDLKASISPSNATEMGITWKSSNAKVAAVDNRGRVSGLMGGVAVITATTVDGKYSATCVVTVRELITSLSLNHEVVRIGVDKSIRLEATVSNSSASNQKVRWISSNESIAIVDSNGKVTGIAYGKAVVTALARDGSGAEASCEVEVVRLVERVTVNRSSLNMYVGDVRQITATLAPQNATYKDVIWTSSDPSVAVVDEDGGVTAVAEGSAVITAQALDNGGKKATVHVTVNKRVSSTGITVMDKKLVMIQGETKTVQAVLNPINSTDGFTWSTSNAGVARVDKQTGLITARSTGTADITVMTDSGKTATIQITVIGLNQNKLTLEQYTTANLYVEGASGAVRWHSENTNIATVQNGRVVTRAVGKTRIIATVNGRQIVCELTVTKIR